MRILSIVAVVITFCILALFSTRAFAEPEWVIKYRSTPSLAEQIAVAMRARRSTPSEGSPVIAAAVLQTTEHGEAEGLRGAPIAPALPRERNVTLATDPVALVTGTYVLAGSLALTRHVALRGTVEASEGVPALADSGTWKTGVTLPLFLDQTFRGPYLEPGIVLARRVTGYDIVPATDTMPESYVALRERTIGPQIFVGWQWMSRSGIHLAAAIGASRNWSTSRSGTSVPAPESYLRIGYAF